MHHRMPGRPQPRLSGRPPPPPQTGFGQPSGSSASTQSPARPARSACHPHGCSGFLRKVCLSEITSGIMSSSMRPICPVRPWDACGSSASVEGASSQRGSSERCLHLMAPSGSPCFRRRQPPSANSPGCSIAVVVSRGVLHRGHNNLIVKQHPETTLDLVADRDRKAFFPIVEERSTVTSTRMRSSPTGRPTGGGPRQPWRNRVFRILITQQLREKVQTLRVTLHIRGSSSASGVSDSLDKALPPERDWTPPSIQRHPRYRRGK